MNLQPLAIMARWTRWQQVTIAHRAIHLSLVNSKPRRNSISFSYDAWMFFVTPHLRDKRDLSTYRRPRYLPSRFNDQLNCFVKRLGIEKTIKNAHIVTSEGHTMVVAAAQKLWKSLDTDLSLTLLDLSHIGTPECWKMILSAKIDPSSAYYQEAGSDLFLRDYQAVSFLKKYSGFTFDDVNPEYNALVKWLEAERECGETNKKFEEFAFDKFDMKYLFVIKRVIQEILGSSPSLADLRENLRVGPGASASCPSSFSSILDKIDQIKTVSTRSASIVERILESSPFEDIIPRLVVSPCTTIGFVPKRWDVHRPIEIPEDIDMLIQLSIGTLIRKRLKKFGLDLDTQATRNGELARIGSIDDSILTEDLQSASDTIAYRLVEFLLPKGWFNILSRFRSPIVSYKDPTGKEFFLRNRKFSAMGNGYTFELETLIFLAITLASGGPSYSYAKKCPNNIGVFGDDICCPTAFKDTLEYLLNLCGFTTNIEKSFSAGKFRESCGQDFYAGAPVRPYFHKKEVSDVTQLYVMANGIRRASVRSCYSYASDIRYRDVWSSIIDAIPEDLRVFGPSDLSDSVLWGNPEDRIAGEWPIHENQSWTYRTGPATLVQRGINLFAYSGGTLVSAWGLIKGSFVSTPYAVTKRSGGECDTYRLKTASLVPRTFRRGSFTRFRRSTFVFSIKYDCPPFQ